MIQFENVSLYRGTKCLLNQVNFTAYPGWHIALIGQNGCGKSSLFALIQGQLNADSGHLQLASQTNIAHMAQEVAPLERSAINYVMDGDQQLRSLQQQLVQAEAQNQLDAIARLHASLADADAYRAEAKAAKLLSGLGFSQEQFGYGVKTFSGGWRMRLNLAQALMSRSDILLLDEPTNHLDLDAIIWLESWLQNYPGTLILISHDREFIDAVVNHVIHIEHQTLNYYSGNYSSFEQQRSARLAGQQAAYIKQQREIAHLQQFITRFKAKATKAKQAQSRVKTLERMEKIAPAHVDSPFHFSIPSRDKSSSILLDLTEADLGYGDNPVLKSVSLQLMPADRIGLIGPNGAGKSTLIKTLVGETPLINGERQQGEHCYLGYFAQHQLDQLDSNGTPLLCLQRQAATTDEQRLRNYLGGFGFQGDAVHDPIGRFSGGEKARLALALIIWHKPNLLLLDEPTNHLDLEMRQALTMALQEYDGGLILVSHDRHLLRATTDEFYLVANHQVERFDGDLDDYTRWLADYRQPALQQATAKSDRKNQRQQNAQKRQQLQPLKKQIRQLEQAIDQLETQKQNLAEQLNDPDLYADGKKDQLQELLKQQGLIMAQLEEKEAAWMDASETLQGLEDT